MHEIQVLLHDFGLKTNFTLVLLTVVLLASRVIPIVSFSPMLGGETTPPDVKIGTGLLLSLVMFPAVSGSVNRIPVSALAFITLLFKEIFIGYTLSFIVSALFEAARIAGNIIDTQAGAAQAQIHVPQIQTQITIFSTFKMMLAVTLFLTMNGHHIIISSLADSFAVIPVDQFPHFGHGMWSFFELVSRTFGDMLGTALALAAPAMIAAFLADLSLGMVNRVAPQLQVFFMAMALKPLVATLMMFVAINMILQRLGLEAGHTLKLFRDAIQLLR